MSNAISSKSLQSHEVDLSKAVKWKRMCCRYEPLYDQKWLDQNEIPWQEISTIISAPHVFPFSLLDSESVSFLQTSAESWLTISSQLLLHLLHASDTSAQPPT